MRNLRQKVEIKNSLKKILKLTFFLLVREFYLFLGNLYGLICHPFLTVKRIEKERDFSQKLLISALPGYFWFLTVGFLAFLRFLIGIKGELGWVAKTSLIFISFLAFFSFIYIFYWISLVNKNLTRGKK